MVASLTEEITKRIPRLYRAGKTYALHVPDEDGTMKLLVMEADSQLFRDFTNLRWIGGKESPLKMLREMGHEV